MLTKIRVFFAVLAGKAVKAFCRIVKKGGTAMPGKFALKLYPDLLQYLAKDVESVVVTGTNGKTTCCRMVEESFRLDGRDYLANRSGANLEIGIVTDFMDNCTVTGKMKKKYAVMECDEAASKRVFALMQPKVILVTNLFNDQLDRFGTVKNTLENIRIGVSGAPGAVLCLNADEPLSADLAKDVPNKVFFYGIEASALNSGTEAVDSDESKCVHCGAPYEYSYVTIAHLGGFSCPACGYSRKSPDFAVTEIKVPGADSSVVTLKTPDGERELTVSLPAVYNIYNAAATVAAATAAGVGRDAAFGAPASFKCGFGRMERFELGKAGSRMILVKNAAGCNQVIDFMSKVEGEYTLSLCFNNRVSDGTDFSWINLAEFEKIAANKENVRRIYLSGDRIKEARERLLAAGFEAEKLIDEPDYRRLVAALAEEEVPVYIMPTYTAMMECRDAIIKRIGGTQFFDL